MSGYFFCPSNLLRGFEDLNSGFFKILFPLQVTGKEKTSNFTPPLNKKLLLGKKEIKKSHLRCYRWDTRVEKLVKICYNNAILMLYFRKGDAIWDSQKK
ncbi:hypothetical protein DQQ01_08205 [Blautia argi]|uniref:Uncharacterized protein n=1 Tax=Blautia argi TaxID=1912897 RepID=A0A2Z4UBC6_9FIRM|nr:hypothetical protein DQQ01_08205 [Blautia argi]